MEINKTAAIGYDQARIDAIKKVLSIGLTGLGVGAAARGAVGLKNLMQPPMQQPFVSPGPSTLELPVAATEEDEDPDLAMLAKQAADSPILDRVATTLNKYVPSWGDKYVSNMSYAPWMMPAMLGAGALGVAGGWGMTGGLLQDQQKAKRDEALAAAQAEYERALAEQSAAGVKSAAAELYSELDELFDLAMEKQAINLGQAAVDTGGMSLAALLSILGVSAVGTGKFMYDYQRSRAKDTALNKAMSERARQMWNNNAQQVAVVPKPISVA